MFDLHPQAARTGPDGRVRWVADVQARRHGTEFSFWNGRIFPLAVAQNPAFKIRLVRKGLMILGLASYGKHSAQGIQPQSCPDKRPLIFIIIEIVRVTEVGGDGIESAGIRGRVVPGLGIPGIAC